jgi:hypothetical protein
MRALLPRKADAEKILNEMHQIETTNRNPAQTIMRYEPGSDSELGTCFHQLKGLSQLRNRLSQPISGVGHA